MSWRSWICFLQWVLAGVLFIGGVLALSSCGGTPGASFQEAEQQAAWNALISSHTMGVVSRKSAVRVRFATDVAPADGSHPDLRRTVTIEPDVESSIAFDGSREIVLEPKKDLQPGRTYLVRIHPQGLSGVRSDLRPYEFRFRVQAPDFEVQLRGLEAAGGDLMRLHGVVTSADVEDATKLEQVLKVSFLGKSLPLQWSHTGLKHEFTASDLRRPRERQSLLVKWDGKVIGAATAGEQSVEVPARGRFLVTQEQVLEEQGRRRILVYFSEALDPGQDLAGLVHLSQGTISSHVQGNTLVVYPEEDPQGDVTLTVEPGIRDERGDRLEEPVQQTLTFGSLKPQVRFAGRGVILPDGKTLTIPFESVGARSVHVTALRVYDDNMGQFLQVNKLDGNAEMGRVGRFLWRKRIVLSGPANGRWSRYELDVTELMRKYPGGLFQLTLQLTPADSTYACAPDRQKPAADEPPATEPTPKDQEDSDTIQRSNWDYAEEYFDANGATWGRRGDPCDTSYFVYGENVRAQRNLIASNIGLLAKRDQQGRLLVAATDLSTGMPRSGVELTVRNYQNRTLAKATTDRNGLASLSPLGTPFLLVGESGEQRGYLKLSPGNALPTSHFDVGGETVAKGVKGFIYGDRGVWRPGDTLYLTFVLQDKSGTLPPGHPVTLELYDPRGRLAQTTANTTPVEGFYRFDLKTAPDAPTGDWTAKVILGELSFTRHLRVETVMPNRLKVALELGSLESGKPLRGTVSAQWLTGASAARLKADVKLALAPTATHFGRFADYVFDDPAREFATKSEGVFEGELDAQGAAKFERPLALQGSPPGMLSATFITRVFERGGAFSVNRETTPYAPYPRFVGVRLPKGDAARDMLQTDQEHTVEIATLSAAGEPVSVSQIRVTLFKVEWKWWWDKTGDSLAQYAQANSNSVVRQDTVSTVNGAGQWKFQINFPEWGRYLLRVCDPEAGHCAGRTFYIDWPSWAGKEREQSGAAANVLAITSDKPRYVVGETATVQLPESAQGRALLTVENGTDIMDARWIEPKAGNTRFTLPVTAAMAPNVYIAVTLIQPHENKANDRPIRLYGVIPVEVTDPQTRLTPAIRTADEWKPEGRAEVEVTEAQGRAMTYTLAVVDEGLLSLTNFRTPDLHEYFYSREALGVATWDLYDDVVGAYGTELERLLALGGSDAAPQTDADQARSRFPPVVRFLGPFRLQAGAKATHQIDLPRYLGAVRVMVVAGEKGAYGSAEKSVFVRQPLMLLPTMPRVIGPGEEVAVPVSVFVSDPLIKEVTLTIEPGEMFSPVGATSTRLQFQRPEEELGLLRLKAVSRLGQGHVKLIASSGEHRAESDIYIDVRSANPPTTIAVTRTLQPGETWNTDLVPHGIEGTNQATLEVSSMPALDLESRLSYLIQYPFGCLEQTTSSVFPQLYLSSLVKLEPGRQEQIEDNIRNGIERLRWFQLPNGGFSYWPGANGGFAAGSLEGYALWATTYASHFLIEAERAGYTLPPTMRSHFIGNLKNTAQRWTLDEPASGGSTLDQAYRLYVLALAGQPEVGAMNRLREAAHLPNTERWILAATYKLAGLEDLADSLVSGTAADAEGPLGQGPNYTFGSQLRDRAMVLQSLITLGRLDRSADLVKAISAELSSQGWYSTQSVAYSLMAMSKLAGAGPADTFTFEHNFGTATTRVVSHSPVYEAHIAALPQAGQGMSIHNTSQRSLFVTVATRGVPEAGADDSASSGLSLRVTYTDEDGKAIEVGHVPQGTDFIAHVEVRNLTPLRIDNIALTHIFPAGWEIHNDRMDSASVAGTRDEPRRPRNPWMIPDGSRDSTQPSVDYTDIRDDRVLQFFGLRSGETIQFDTRLNAAYRGRYYLPSVLVEAMYDATKSARTSGQWTEVSAPSR